MPRHRVPGGYSVPRHRVPGGYSVPRHGVPRGTRCRGVRGAAYTGSRHNPYSYNHIRASTRPEFSTKSTRYIRLLVITGLVMYDFYCIYNVPNNVAVTIPIFPIRFG